METHLEHRDRVGVADAVLLEDYTNDSAFVENLEKRFKEDLIYTNIGPVLVSVNPYKDLKIYGPEYIKDYENKHFFEVPPHVFALTDTAYRSLKEENREQCILISGESGSGKTEASKKVLQYIASITEHKGAVEKVKDKLLQSNPLLEAFGNAKTNRNDNSSRFGKYMDVQFDFQGLPVGGNILNYLLEKSRVINQAPGERNFHIFYQIIAGASDAELEKLYLNRSLDDYYYLSHGVKSNGTNLDDAKSYASIQKALQTLEFEASEENDMFAIVATVLHLGNIEFVGDDSKSELTNDDTIETISKLLGIDLKKLKKALTHRTITAHGDVVVTPLNRELAVYARDALAKAIYDRLFTWLVQRLNQSLQPTDSRRNIAMGILDIYGFEIFEKNSFEQLCINFCNEKLQQLFIELTLKSEQEEYLKEGIEWQHVEYFDNKVICDLIEEKHKGIISVMDEECLRPGEPNDATMLAKMNKSFKSHIHYISHEKADIQTQKIMGRDEFRLIHYAGDVTYNINGFLEKNNDLLFRDLKEAMSSASNAVIKSVFPPKEQESMKRPETAITQFKTSVNNLCEILIDKEPSYIRCIKPNEVKRQGVFDVTLVRHQVKYLGLMENLRVRRAGFAYRRLYDKFLQRYKCLCTETWPHWHGAPRDGVQKLVIALKFEANDYQMGKTKIFIRFPKMLFKTEDAYQARKHELASLIAATYKARLQRIRYLKMKACIIIMQKWVRRFQARRLADRRRKAAAAVVRLVRGYLTRNGPATDINRAFVQLAKQQWLNRLSRSLPTNILDRKWPPCPTSCEEASKLLEGYYATQMSRHYRKKLTPERKQQFELKIFAETLFKDKKKSYQASLPHFFVYNRLAQDQAMVTDFFRPSGEQVKYITSVMKYDRHGYKPRNRILVATNQAIYLLEATKSVKQKHRFPLDAVDLVVTSGKDNLVMIKIPDNMIKKDKGDLILEVPNLIEAITVIVDIRKNPKMLSILDSKTIEHQLEGKRGVIEITTGNQQGIHKSKSGHLLIVASP